MRRIIVLITAYYAVNNGYIYRIKINTMAIYIHHLKNWTHFIWDNDALIHKLAHVRNMQGKLVGKLEVLGFDLKEEANLLTLTEDVIKSSAIEGENLDKDQVRSSIARRLGLDISGLIPSDRNVDGVVEMMIDAVNNAVQPLTEERLFNWHAALFPTGRSGMFKIQVAQWREDIDGPMQVVSGPLGRENIHFEAPASKNVPDEMKAFLIWFNEQQNVDTVLKAAIAHFWFVTIHPFDDGNGRIARTLGDMILTRADGNNKRFYSMSSQIRQNRKEYYEILEHTQKGDQDITKWLLWFCDNLLLAIENAEQILTKVIVKHHFYRSFRSIIENDRQQKIINMLLDGFEGKLNTSKWAKINKVSSDTALRDINDLLEKNILIKSLSGGRSTSYELNLKGIIE